MLDKASFYVLIFLFMASCSTKDMRRESYAFPELPKTFNKKLNKDEKSFILVALNNFNAQLNSLDGHGPSIGGSEVLERYLTILKEVYPEESLILSTGYLTSEQNSTSLINLVYQTLNKFPFEGVGASALELKSSQKSGLPLINSNVFKISTGSLLEQPNMQPYRIYEKGGLKIGVLSVTPPPNEEVINGLYFEDAVASILKNHQKLKREGADIVVLISHYPSLCETDSPQFVDERQLVCQENSPLKNILDRLPKKEVDIVISSGQKFSFGKLNETYIMNTPGNGLYLDLIKVVFNSKEEKITPNKTIHLGPVLLCKEFFSLTNDCFIGSSRKRFQELEESNFEKKPASFLGQPIINK